MVQLEAARFANLLARDIGKRRKTPSAIGRQRVGSQQQIRTSSQLRLITQQWNLSPTRRRGVYTSAPCTGYRLLFRHLKAFGDHQGIRFLRELDTAILRNFRTSWKDGNLASLKKLEQLRAFFRFAHENGWIDRNPATAIKNPKVVMRPTLPYSRSEMMLMLETATRYIDEIQSSGRANAQRLRALILLLRYTGLRIGDAVGCSVDRLIDGKLRIYTQKTGTHVHCPLPEFVIRELDSIPRITEKYWFWNENTKIKTAVTAWQERLATLSAKAKIANGHAHRFRDTFAVELLLSGVPLERVSVLLGHRSI